jgi:SAM-dependent methyltransferase
MNAMKKLMNSPDIREYRKKNITISKKSLDYIFDLGMKDFIKNNCKDNYDKILDFGAGNSPYKHLLQYKDYITADVVQNSSSSINVILQSNIKDLPFGNEEFDLILCLDVIEHLINPKEILLELFRKLKPKGKLMISTPFIFREHEYPDDFQRFTSVGIENILTDVGFSKINTKKSGNWYYTIFLLWIGKVIKNNNFENIRKLSSSI